MTVQRSNAITLEEIIGIQLECRNQKCKVRVTVPVSSQGRLPIACAYCGDPWWVNNRTDLHQIFFTAINEFITAMKQIADGSNNVNCILTIEVKPEIRSTETGASLGPAV